MLTNSELATLLKAQILISVVIGFLFASLPFYMLYRYGLSVQPIYDGQGNVIGHASYFLASLAMAGMGVSLSIVAYWAAKKIMRGLPNHGN